MTVALCSAFNPHLLDSLASESEDSIYVDVFFFCVFLILTLATSVLSGLSENRRPSLHLTLCGFFFAT